jgi:hypothetical protein
MTINHSHIRTTVNCLIQFLDCRKAGNEGGTVSFAEKTYARSSTAVENCTTY